MIVPDPEKDIADALLNRSVDVLALGTAVGSTGYAFLLLNQLAALKKRNSARLKMNAVEISRRNFLKLGAATAVAIPSMLNATASLLNEAGTPLDQNLLLEDFLLSSIDYRNVCIAKAIFEVAKADSKITVLYGANHYEGVRHYLYDEVLLDERLGIYQKTFGMWSPDKAEEFDFS